jgi:protein-S-isoprenylcysteine O-methyltransferase Ste14
VLKAEFILRVILVSARLVGQGSLLLFLVFLYWGSLHLVQLNLAPAQVIAWDGLLSIIFFVQHSGMVRTTFRDRIYDIIPPLYHGALYTFVSSLVLALVIVLWQELPAPIYELQGLALLLVRGFFFMTIAGCFWAMYSLRAFDTFGLEPIKGALSGKRIQPPKFVVRGPYRWVRHPLYLLMILMIWSCPKLTCDRLFFNVLWTVWIWVGIVLEEGDLVATFGEKYQDYKKQVPMLIPWKGSSYSNRLL